MEVQQNWSVRGTLWPRLLNDERWRWVQGRAPINKLRTMILGINLCIKALPTKIVIAILAEQLAEGEKGLQVAAIGVHWPPYEVKMSFLRGLKAVLETRSPAWCGQNGPQVDFPSSDKVFWDPFGLILVDFGDWKRIEIWETFYTALLVRVWSKFEGF